MLANSHVLIFILISWQAGNWKQLEHCSCLSDSTAASQTEAAKVNYLATNMGLTMEIA